MNNNNTDPSQTVSLIRNLNYYSSWPPQSLVTQSRARREERAWQSQTFSLNELGLSSSLPADLVDSPESRTKKSYRVARPRRNSSLPINFDPETKRLSYSTNDSRVRLQSTLIGSPILTDGPSSVDSELLKEGSSDDTCTLKLMEEGTRVIAPRKETARNDKARPQSYCEPRTTHSMRLTLGHSWPRAGLGADLWQSPKLGLNPSDNPSFSFPLPPRRISLQLVTHGSQLVAEDVPSGSVQSLCSRTPSSAELRTPVRASHEEAEDCDPYLVLGDQLAQSYLRAIDHVPDDTAIDHVPDDTAIDHVPDDTSTLKDEDHSVDADNSADSEELYTDAATSFMRLSLLPPNVEKDGAIRQLMSFLPSQPSSEEGTFCFSGIVSSMNLSPTMNYAQSPHTVQGSIGSTLPTDNTSFWSTDLRATESQNTVDFSSERCSWVSAASHLDSTEGETLRKGDPTIVDKARSASTTPTVSEGSMHGGICGTRIIKATPTLQSDLIKRPHPPSVPHDESITDQVPGYSRQEPCNFPIGLGLEDQHIRRRKNLQSVLGAGFHMNLLQPDIIKSEAAAGKAPSRSTLSCWTRKVQSVPKKLKKTKPKMICHHQLGSTSTLDVQIAVPHNYHLSFPESSNS